MKTNNRKAVSLLTALLMTGGSFYTGFSTTSYAAEMSASYEAFISVPENTIATNGMFTITFDAQTTQVSEVSAGAMPDGILTASSIKEGKVTFAFVSSKPVNIGGNILKITYTSTQKDPGFTLETNELVSYDESGADINVSSENIRISAAENDSADISFSFSPDFQTNEAADTFKVKASVPAGTGVTNGVIRISFDPSEISLSDIRITGGLEKAISETNIGNGYAKIVFVNTSPINDESTVEFEIKGKKEAVTKLTLSADEFYSMDDKGNFNPVSVITVEKRFSVLPEQNIETKAFPITLTADKNDADVIKVTADIPAGTGVTNGFFTINFNSDDVSLSDITVNGGLKNTMLETNIGKDFARIVFVNTSPVADAGTVEFTLTGKKDADTTVSFVADEFYSIDKNGDVSAVKTESAEKTFHVIPYDNTFDRFDVNDDGTVNADDIAALRKAVLSGDSSDKTDIYDIDNSGTVDVLDLKELVMYIADI